MKRAITGRSSRIATLVVAAVGLVGCVGAAAGQSCAWEWTPLGTGVEPTETFPNAYAQAMAVWDDGSGPALYVGGAFVIADGQVVNRIAKWDGQTWSALGTGMSASGPIVPASVLALAVYDDGLGGGPDLYAAGVFLEAGGVDVNRVARWDGQSWSAVGDGITGAGATVWALATYDDGTGPALYAAGRFTEAAGLPANRIAKWNGTAWSAVGTVDDIDQEIYALRVFNDGSGAALYAGGHFTMAGGVPASKIARWNGTAWSALGSGLGSFAISLAAFNDGGGEALLVGGDFTTAGGQPANHMAKWNGAAWSAVGSGLDDFARASAVMNVGGVPVLFEGGEFTLAGGQPAGYVASWDGTAWSTMNGGFDAPVHSMAVYDDGTGPALYVGGQFSSAGGVPVNNIARWSCNPTGACCMPSGACEVRTQQSCVLLGGGAYHGDGATCAAIGMCPQPPTGACCAPSGCIVVWAGGCAEQHGVYRGDGAACDPGACDGYVFDVEPNNTRAESLAVVLSDGGSIVGVSTGTDVTPGSTADETVDYFRIRTAPAAPGIYRHRMRVHDGAVHGNGGSIRTRVQFVSAPGVWPCDLGFDITDLFGFDVGTAPVTDGDDVVSDWYGFGREEQVYYRVEGAASSTGVYETTLESQAVTPTDVGDFAPGTITIATGGPGNDNNTGLWVLDSNYQAIPGYSNNGGSVNGGAPADTQTTSFLRRSYVPGTYYLGIAVGYVATSLGSPCDDSVALGVLLDFPDAALGVDTDEFPFTDDVSFSITDEHGTAPVAASREGPGQIRWFRFDVVAACPADFNGSGAVSVQDIFDFLGAYFGSDPRADINNSGSISVQDIFDFLASYFAGCP